MHRCEWARAEQMIAYHDTEWGAPVHDDRTLFEFLILEGAQAGLSWSTILKKRAAYRQAFAEFDPARVAAYDESKVAELLANPGIVRNRRKIEAAIGNARALLPNSRWIARRALALPMAASIFLRLRTMPGFASNSATLLSS